MQAPRTLPVILAFIVALQISLNTLEVSGADASETHAAHESRITPAPVVWDLDADTYRHQQGWPTSDAVPAGQECAQFSFSA